MGEELMKYGRAFCAPFLTLYWHALLLRKRVGLVRALAEVKDELIAYLRNSLLPLCVHFFLKWGLMEVFCAQVRGLGFTAFHTLQSGVGGGRGS